MKRRKGNLIVVVTFAALMTVVIIGTMSVGSSLYSTSRDSAKAYSRIQTYRAVTELACYQYVTSLETAVVTKDLDADWVSVSGNAIYTQAIDAIVASIGTSEDPTIWEVRDAKTALTAMDVSDPSILTDIYAELEGVRQEFQLQVIAPLKLDWSDPDSWRNRRGAYVALEPVRIEVSFDVRGEHLFEHFEVDGLYLEVSASELMVGGERHDTLTLVLVEKAEGVSITRATS